MPKASTRQFGYVEYGEDAVVEFAEPLPGFPEDRQFVVIEPDEWKPLLFLQSLDHPELCFTGLPVGCVAKDYRLWLGEEDLAALGMTSVGDPSLCVALVTVKDSPTVNLMAPVVIHARLRRARQVIQFDSGYSFEHPLRVVGEGGDPGC